MSLVLEKKCNKRRQAKRRSHYHSHLSLHACRLKLAFSLKRTKHAHSSITSEATAGNHITSELIRIREMVMVDHADVSHIMTWRDVISLLNHNSIYAFAMAKFSSEWRDIQSITMKYSAGRILYVCRKLAECIALWRKSHVSKGMFLSSIILL